MEAKIPVGVLGATGTVGQKFIKLLEHHPWFEVAELAASERSAGRPYEEVVAWKQTTPIPDAVRHLELRPCATDLKCRVVFSGLDAAVAGPIMEIETRKILGRFNGEAIDLADFQVSAQCNRVPVEDGHTESVSLKLARKASVEEISDLLRSFSGPPQQLRLPSAPERPILVMDASDRPQPRFDVGLAGGMAAVVGRIRPCPVLDFKFTLLGHNTIRGAAGASMLNAELLKAQGYLKQ